MVCNFRFGWPFCRLAAREISLIQPQLKEHNVRLIGIGLEPLGLQEFLDGNFFAGELFVDKDKKAFSKLNFKRLSFLQLFPAVFAKKAREAVAKAKVGCNLFFTLRNLVISLLFIQRDKSKFVWNISVWWLVGWTYLTYTNSCDFFISIFSLRNPLYKCKTGDIYFYINIYAGKKKSCNRYFYWWYA